MKIKRDGVDIGRNIEAIKDAHAEVADQEKNTRREKVKLSELVPFEASVVKPTLAKIASNREKHPPPSVLDVNGRLLVVDGTHRVRAAVDAGETEIEVVVKPCLKKDIERYEQTIALRDCNKTTFATLPVDDDDKARADRTEKELTAISKAR